MFVPVDVLVVAYDLLLWLLIDVLLHLSLLEATETPLFVVDTFVSRFSETCYRQNVSKTLRKLPAQVGICGTASKGT